MASIVQFFLLSSLVFFISPSFSQQSFRPKALILQVARDPSTLQYTTTINQRTPLVPVKLTVDLGGQYFWVDCEQGYVSSTYKPARCRSAQCSLARSRSCGTCNGPAGPGCNNDTCSLLPENSVTSIGTIGEVAQDVVSLQSTDGRNPGRVVSVPNLLFTCGSTFLLEGLASGVKGMAGLGRAKIGLPSLLSAAFSFPRKFAICLSSSERGAMFFGDGPYVFLPGMDASRFLSFTPLILNPVSTASAYFAGEASTEYFIGIKSIRVSEIDVPLNKTLLTINKEGVGGTKLSTVRPYTVMQTSIYNVVVDAFVKEISKMNVTRVPSVAPFGACFNREGILSTRVGPSVPTIDLVMQNDRIWRIFGANSMVFVTDDVLCLAFVDGGQELRTSIVIGGHQLEDTLIQVDLAASRLGFSSTLLFRQTTCANFNFTSNA